MGHARPVVRVVLIAAALIAPFFFTIGITSFIALIAAAASPSAPLAVGIIIDALYWTKAAYPYPFGTFAGALLTAAAFMVHSFIETRIMRV